MQEGAVEIKGQRETWHTTASIEDEWRGHRQRMQAASKTRKLLHWQPARKLRPQSHSHTEGNSGNKINEQGNRPSLRACRNKYNPAHTYSVVTNPISDRNWCGFNSLSLWYFVRIAIESWFIIYNFVLCKQQEVSNQDNEEQKYSLPVSFSSFSILVDWE